MVVGCVWPSDLTVVIRPSVRSIRCEEHSSRMCLQDFQVKYLLNFLLKCLSCGHLVHGVFRYVNPIISPFCTLTCCHYSPDRACELESALITHHGFWADVANRKQFSGKEAL